MSLLLWNDLIVTSYNLLCHRIDVFLLCFEKLLVDDMLMLKLGYDESAWLVHTTQLLLVESKVQRLQVTSKLVRLKIHL